MKTLSKKIISLFLTLTMIFSLSAPAFAIENPKNYFDSETVTEAEDKSVELIIKDAYNNLSPKAKEKALSVISNNPDLLQYYITEIDPTFSVNQYKHNSTNLFRARANVNDPVKNIERSLRQIGVPTSVIVAAVGVASSLVVAAADGPLPFGDAYALFQSGKFITVVAKNWKVIAPLFGSIVLIFKNELGNSVNNITKLFNKIESDAKKEADSKENNKKDEKKTVNPDGLTKEEEKAINDILSGTKTGKKSKGRTRQFEKEGSYQDAEKDFDKIPLQDEKTINTKWGKGKTGKLSNGKSVTVRPGSSYGSPTLQIPEGSSRQIEIRYK